MRPPPRYPVAYCPLPFTAGSAEVRVLCVPLRLLLFRIDKRVNAHGVKSRGGGLKCAHLRATPLPTAHCPSQLVAQRYAYFAFLCGFCCFALINV